MPKRKVCRTERRVAVPTNASWDDFLDAPGTDLGDRRQPRAQERDDL